MIRLIIADDHPVIIDGIRMTLEKEKNIQLVAQVSNGKELLEALEQEQVDVVLTDINMPGTNGIEATKIIKEKYPDIKVLAFSQYAEKRFIKQVMKRGAAGYVLKNVSAKELLNAITMVYEGGMYLSPELPNVFGEQPRCRSNYLFPELTRRELEVVKQISEEKNTQEIADALFISYNTVESHRSNILLKVGVKNTAGLMKWAVENEMI